MSVTWHPCTLNLTPSARSSQTQKVPGLLPWRDTHSGCPVHTVSLRLSPQPASVCLGVMEAVTVCPSACLPAWPPFMLSLCLILHPSSELPHILSRSSFSSQLHHSWLLSLPTKSPVSQLSFMWGWVSGEGGEKWGCLRNSKCPGPGSQVSKLKGVGGRLV